MKTDTLRRRAAQDYPHRLNADGTPKFGDCPVCCGDRVTTDRRYAGGPEIEANTPSPLYPCFCREEVDDG